MNPSSVIPKVASAATSFIVASPVMSAVAALKNAKTMSKQEFSHAYNATALRQGFVVDMYNKGGKK